MTERPHILVVCARNKKRSRTAEYIFKNDNRFAIRSVGLSVKSPRKISENDLNWASLVLVMENNHRAKIKDIYSFLDLPPIEVLGIPDYYEFMDVELKKYLRTKSMLFSMRFLEFSFSWALIYSSRLPKFPPRFFLQNRLKDSALNCFDKFFIFIINTNL